MLGRDVDVAVGPQKAECEPLLPLAAEPALPDPRHQFHRQVIGEPVAALPDIARAIRPHFLMQLAPGGLLRLLARVDSALGHLPGGPRIVDPLRHEHLAPLVDQHDADARPVRQLCDLLFSQGRWLFLHGSGGANELGPYCSISALAGTSEISSRPTRARCQAGNRDSALEASTRPRDAPR